MQDYKYCIVTDSEGYYVDYVLMLATEAGWTMTGYTLHEGDVLLDAPAPVLREAIGDGFVRPLWDEAQWTEGATAEEIAQWEAEHPAPTMTADEVRATRDRLLTDCDWTQIADAPLNEVEKTAWATYRQDLRDVPQQVGFPADVVWPVAPMTS